MLDVVVIGSGYGGAVIAARLAPHARVLIVERGRWWRAGDFPDTLLGLARAYKSARNPDGLWGMRFGAGTGVGFASAVGGSSPVNYGITARPDDHAFDGWPIGAAALAPWFERAREVLRPAPDPDAVVEDKRFLDQVEPGRRVDLENTIDWARCTRCGDCVPGCNLGAKRSLDETYLALALDAGAELRVSCEVQAIAKDGDGWRVALAGGEILHARRVVVAAGTLGTLDLLHRSALPVTAAFGRALSLNGDALAFLYDMPHPVSTHVGAPITTSVRIPVVGGDGRTRTLMVMAGRVPRLALRIAAAGLVATSMGRAGRAHWSKRLRDLVRVDGDGALARSFMFKLDAQDEGRGVARFEPGGVVIDWPDYADDPILRFAEARLAAWARAVGGTVIPHVARLPGLRGFSVHPLGGCAMGRVVDDFGRVLDPRGGVHDGLRIADGSIVPGAIGVPPSWTIAALAERIADDLIRDVRAARA